MESIEGMRLLKAPPVSILMSLEQMEATVIKSNDANVKLAFIEQSLFSIACALSETSGVSLVPLYINVKLESPTAFPERTSCELGSFTTNPSSGDLGDRSAKRLKHEMNGHQDGAEAHEKCSDLMDEVRHFSELIMTTLNEAYH